MYMLAQEKKKASRKDTQKYNVKRKTATTITSLTKEEQGMVKVKEGKTTMKKKEEEAKEEKATWEQEDKEEEEKKEENKKKGEENEE